MEMTKQIVDNLKTEKQQLSNLDNRKKKRLKIVTTVTEQSIRNLWDNGKFKSHVTRVSEKKKKNVILKNISEK